MPDESLIEFRSRDAATAFLRRLARDPVRMAALRRLLSDSTLAVHRLSEDDVIRLLAARFVAERIVIGRSRRIPAFPMAEPDEEPAPLPPLRPRPVEEPALVDVDAELEEEPLLDFDAQIEEEPLLDFEAQVDEQTSPNDAAEADGAPGSQSATASEGDDTVEP